jgi:signal transduction histidine kinase
VQEQVSNILKYSEATNVIIDLTSHESKVKLLIGDNGKGFDPAVKAKGIGFHNIASRAKLFNGSMSIDSSIGNGCRVAVSIYCEQVKSFEVA